MNRRSDDRLFFKKSKKKKTMIGGNHSLCFLVVGWLGFSLQIKNNFYMCHFCVRNKKNLRKNIFKAEGQIRGLCL